MLYIMDASKRMRLDELESSYDFVVVGGGAGGLGTALDLAGRDCRVLLVEGEDFASGTSSRSTKLVHGGVRYLRQGNVALVRRALRERQYLFDHAPQLVSRTRFYIPCRAAWEEFYYRFGMGIYSMLAGPDRAGGITVLRKRELEEQLPGIKSELCRSAVGYIDGQFDDARMALVLARTIAAHGGVVRNYTRCEGLLHEQGRVSGVLLRDTLSGDSREVRARCVVNAAGAFADDLRGRDLQKGEGSIRLSRGTHIVLAGSWLPGPHALMVPSTDDGRVFFAIPWQGHTLLGTTDVAAEVPENNPQPSPEEIDFILDHAGRWLARAPGRADVSSVFAGLRTFMVRERASGATSEIPRDHHVEVSPTGLVTVVGGKWTTFRSTGVDVAEHALAQAGLSAAPGRNMVEELQGGAGPADPDPRWSAYGSEIADLRREADAAGLSLENMTAELPLSEAEVRWHIRHELALRLEDVLARRSRCLFLNAAATARIAPTVADLMAAELGWSESRRQEELVGMQALCRDFMLDPA
jgi:glycerol-3-phosphate dehydrogenase